MLEVVKGMRPVVYTEPRLRRGEGKETAGERTQIRYEREKRKVVLETNEEPSRYYPLAEGQKNWTRGALLAEVSAGVAT